MLFHSKRNVIRRIAKIATVAVLGFIGFLVWQYYQFMDVYMDEDVATEICIQNWGGYIELSREVETRLLQAMREPQRYLVIKTGTAHWGTYWFGFFGIDKTRGYMLTNGNRYTGLVEKSYPRKEAEALFNDLTQDYDALTNYSDIRSIQPVCNFIKVAFPTTTKQVRIIGSFDESEDDTSVVLHRKAYDTLFKKAINQAYSNQTQAVSEKAVTAYYQREEKAGHTYVDHQSQVKRATQNIFFELPDGK